MGLQGQNRFVDNWTRAPQASKIGLAAPLGRFLQCSGRLAGRRRRKHLFWRPHWAATSSAAAGRPSAAGENTCSGGPIGPLPTVVVRKLGCGTTVDPIDPTTKTEGRLTPKLSGGVVPCPHFNALFQNVL